MNPCISTTEPTSSIWGLIHIYICICKYISSRPQHQDSMFPPTMAASNTLASGGHTGMMGLGSALLPSTVFLSMCLPSTDSPGSPEPRVWMSFLQQQEWNSLCTQYLHTHTHSQYLRTPHASLYYSISTHTLPQARWTSSLSWSLPSLWVLCRLPSTYLLIDGFTLAFLVILFQLLKRFYFVFQFLIQVCVSCEKCTCKCRCLGRPAEGVGYPGVGVIDGYEKLDVGAGNPTQVASSQREGIDQERALSHPSSPSPHFLFKKWKHTACTLWCALS